MLEVISEGGSTLDEGGDLNAMDAHLRHREYPFRHKRLKEGNGEGSANTPDICCLA